MWAGQDEEHLRRSRHQGPKRCVKISGNQPPGLAQYCRRLLHQHEYLSRSASDFPVVHIAPIRSTRRPAAGAFIAGGGRRADPRARRRTRPRCSQWRYGALPGSLPGRFRIRAAPRRSRHRRDRGSVRGTGPRPLLGIAATLPQAGASAPPLPPALLSRRSSGRARATSIRRAVAVSKSIRVSAASSDRRNGFKRNGQPASANPFWTARSPLTINTGTPRSITVRASTSPGTRGRTASMIAAWGGSRSMAASASVAHGAIVTRQVPSASRPIRITSAVAASSSTTSR